MLTRVKINPRHRGSVATGAIPLRLLYGRTQKLTEITPADSLFSTETGKFSTKSILFDPGANGKC
jgi:hypothetical protein